MKKISRISIFVSTVALAGLCGCASNSNQSSTPAQTTASTTTTTQAPPPKPKKDNRPLEQRLVVGMTMDDVKTACGNPKNEAMNSDGSATWMYAKGSPVFTPFGWGGKVHYVTIVFDTNSKVKSWSSNDSENGPPF